MEKGLLLSINEKDRTCVVVSGGSFYKLPCKGKMKIGMRILFTKEDIIMNQNVAINKKKNTFTLKLMGAVAVFALICITGFGYYSNDVAAYSVVTLDINPSMELVLNKKDVVIDQVAMNDDANDLMKLDLKGDSIDDAVTKIANAAETLGFVNSDEKSFMMITIVPLTNGAKNHIEDLEVKIAKEAKTSTALEYMTLAITEGTKDQLEKALKTRVPLGLLTLGDKMDITNIHSVKELFEDEDQFEILKKIDGVLFEFDFDYNDKGELEIEIEREDDDSDNTDDNALDDNDADDKADDLKKEDDDLKDNDDSKEKADDSKEHDDDSKEKANDSKDHDDDSKEKANDSKDHDDDLKDQADDSKDSADDSKDKTDDSDDKADDLTDKVDDSKEDDDSSDDDNQSDDTNP